METMFELLNPYDLFKSVATNHGTLKDGKKRHVIRMKDYAPWHPRLKNDERVLVDVDFLTKYLGNATVREALHIPAGTHEWSACTERITYTELPEASEWIYRVLKKAGGIKMLHYSGDTDGVLPTFGTKSWIEKSLNWKKLSNFTMWKVDEQVKGMYRQYDGLDFVTIKGVGHMAPQWSPAAAHHMITGYMAGTFPPPIKNLAKD